MRTFERLRAFPTRRLIALLWALVPIAVAAAVGASAPAAHAQFGGARPKIPGLTPPIALGDEEPDEVLVVEAVVAAKKVAPGGDLPIALQFTFAKGWHMWPHKGASLEGMAVFSGAIPTVLSSLRVGGSLVIVGVIVAEMLTSAEGVGYLITKNRTLLDSPRVFGGILIVIFLVLAFDRAVRLLEHRTRFWRLSTQSAGIP